MGAAGSCDRLVQKIASAVPLLPGVVAELTFCGRSRLRTRGYAWSDTAGVRGSDLMLFSPLVILGVAYGAAGAGIRIVTEGKANVDAWRTYGWVVLLDWLATLAIGTAAGFVTVALLHFKVGDPARGAATLAGIFGQQAISALFSRWFGGGH